MQGFAFTPEEVESVVFTEKRWNFRKESKTVQKDDRHTFASVAKVFEVDSVAFCQRRCLAS